VNSHQTTKSKSSKFRSWVQSILRLVVPRNIIFFDWLEGQAHVGSAAAKRLSELSAENMRDVAVDIGEYEHQGDAILARLEEGLAKTFVTPLDREDIQLLATEFDRVLDYAKLAANSCLLRGINQPTEPMLAVIQLLGAASDILLEAVCELRRSGYDRIAELVTQVRELESEGDRIHRDAVAALYQDEQITDRRLRSEEKVLDALEKALNHTEDLANRLRILAVKHG
jgi:uncharacterized protein